jgi:hypothetical protein
MITSSKRYLLAQGKTNAEILLMIIKMSPINTMLRRGQMMVLKAEAMVTFFFVMKKCLNIVMFQKANIIYVKEVCSKCINVLG